MSMPPNIEPDEQIKRRSKKTHQIVHVLSNNFKKVIVGVLNKGMQFTAFDEDSSADFDNLDAQNLLTDEVVRRLEKVFEGEVISCEVQLAEKFYAINSFPLDENDDIQEIICVIQDISDQKARELELEKAFEKEKELGELKSRFVAMAAHEFRNPLTSILASVFLLEHLSGSDYEKEKVNYFNRIKRSVNNLTTILSEFLSLQKLDENKVGVNYTITDVPEFIQGELLSEIDSLRKINQQIEYHHKGNETAYLDHHLLRSILTNLLSNSLKYSPANEKVQVTTELADDKLTLTVNDHGIGIPDDQQPFVFDRFFRARNAVHVEGTGLGLHVVQKYVHLLKGTISFRSKLDKGTQFIVVLPAENADNEDTNTDLTQNINGKPHYES
jgi:signal transduction histidine kinase